MGKFLIKKENVMNVMDEYGNVEVWKCGDEVRNWGFALIFKTVSISLGDPNFQIFTFPHFHIHSSHLLYWHSMHRIGHFLNQGTILFNRIADNNQVRTGFAIQISFFGIFYAAADDERDFDMRGNGSN